MANPYEQDINDAIAEKPKNDYASDIEDALKPSALSQAASVVKDAPQMDYVDYENKNPKTADYISEDPNRIKTLEKNSDVLAKLESTVKDGWAVQKAYRSLVNQQQSGTTEENIQGRAAFASGMERMVANAPVGLALMAKKLLNTSMTGVWEPEQTTKYTDKAFDYIISNPISKKLNDLADADAIISDPDQMGYSDLIKNGDYEKAANKAVDSMVGSVPQILPWALDPLVGGSIATAQTGGEGYQTAKNKGTEENKAQQFGFIKSAIAAPINAIFGSTMFSKTTNGIIDKFGFDAGQSFFKYSVMKWLTNLGINIPLQASQQIAENAAEKHMVDPKVGYFDGVADNAINGVLQLTLMSTPGAMHDYFDGEFNKQISTRNEDAYKQLGALSKQYQDTPDMQYGGFINRIVHDSPYENVKISKQYWNQYWESQGKNGSEEALKYFGEQQYDPKQERVVQSFNFPTNGEEYTVPMQKWLSNIGLTEHHNALSKFVRLGKRSEPMAEVDKKETLPYAIQAGISKRIYNAFMEGPSPENQAIFEGMKGLTSSLHISDAEGKDVTDELIKRFPELGVSNANRTGLESGKAGEPSQVAEGNNRQGVEGQPGRDVFHPGREAETGKHVGQVLEKAGVPEGQLHQLLDKSNLGLMENPRAFGYSDKQAQRLDELHKAARQQAIDEIVQKQERKQSAEYKRQLNEVKEELAKDFDQRPDVKAYHLLQDHTNPDGSPLPEAFKDIPKIKLEDAFTGETSLTEADNVVMESLAKTLGFNGADEMYRSALTAPDRETWLDSAAKAQLDPTPAIEQFKQAVENEKVNSIVYNELKHMASDSFHEFKKLTKGLIKQPKQLDSYKAEARNMIGRMRVEQIDANQILRNIDDCKAEAARCFDKADFRGAFKSKENEMVQRFALKMAMAAEDVKEQGRKENKSWGTKATRELIGKGGDDTLQQGDKIRARFSLSGAKDSGEPKNGLDKWMERQQVGLDKPVYFSPDLMNENYSQPWQEMPYELYRETIGALKMMRYLAENKGKTYLNGKLIDTQSTAEQIKAASYSVRSVEPPVRSLGRDKFWAKFKENPSFFGMATDKPYLVFNEIDGFTPVGPMHDAFDKPATNNQIKENGYVKQIMREMQKQLDAVSVKGKLGKSTKEYFKTEHNFPELKNQRWDGVITPEKASNMLEYCGTDYGMKAVMQDLGIDKNGLDKIFRTVLDDSHVEKARARWKATEFFKDDAYDTHQRRTGIRPQEIKGDPFEIVDKNGKTHYLEGGYVSHRVKSEGVKAAERDETFQERVQNWVGNAKTNDKWAETRRGMGENDSLDYTDKSWLRRTIRDIHDTAWGETVESWRQLMKTDDMRNTLSAWKGQAAIDYMNNYIDRMAAGRALDIFDINNDWIKSVEKLANNLTMTFVGFSSHAVEAHASNALAPIADIGADWMAKAAIELGENRLAMAKDFVGRHLFKTNDRIEDVMNFDPFIKDRLEAGFAEMRENMESYNFKNNKSGYEQWLNMGAVAALRATDGIRTAVTYHAAYMKAMEEGIPESSISAGDHDKAQDYARFMVKKYVGSGQLGDLSPIQAKGGAVRLLTRFYSPFATIGAALSHGGKEAVVTGKWGKFATLAFMGAVIPGMFHNKQNAPEDGDAMDWLSWAVRSPIEFYLQKFPLFRDFSTPAIEKLATGKSTKFSTVMGQFGESAIGAAGSLRDLPNMTKKDISDWMVLTGGVTGFPTYQSWKGFEKAMDTFGQ